MTYSNGEKSQHGKNAQLSIYELLSSCVEKNYISRIISPYRAGRTGYSNTEQFYAPFMIDFPNGESWLLYSTTSMRTDRVKGQQWDTYNLKEINPNITSAFLVYSDCKNLVETSNFEKQNIKYTTNEEYSAIDAIISQDTLYNLIEVKAHESVSLGRLKDIQGRNFEDRIALCLSNKDNLSIFNNNGKTLTGLYYNFFETIISNLDIAPGEVYSIFATTDKNKIGKLPSGGNPKTDILVDICFYNGITKSISISCKRSSANRVSVHEYSADSFSEVLDINNTALASLLHEFQNNPTLGSFGATNTTALTEALKPYNDKLAKWALAGTFGYGDENSQWASHILTYDNNDNSISFYSINEYLDKLNCSKIHGNFGTIFSWTYPSKKRGKSIQLKCPLLK